MPLLLHVLPWLPHTAHRLVRKPGIADLTSCHHFWLFRELEILSHGERPGTVASCSFCSSRLGAHVESHRYHPPVCGRREICRYRHVIGGLVGKSRVCRNCTARRRPHHRPSPRGMVTQRRPHRSSRPTATVSPDETVEFPVSDAADKSVPLGRREPQHRAGGVPAVADADLATRQVSHLDTIAVGVTQRALQPVRTGTRSFTRTPERGAFHVGPSLVGVVSGCAVELRSPPRGQAGLGTRA